MVLFREFNLLMPTSEFLIEGKSAENPGFIPGEIAEFYQKLGDTRPDLTEAAFNQAYRSYIARSGGKIVGAIRANHDGVYTMLEDLKVNDKFIANNSGLKKELLNIMMTDLNDGFHPFIAAMVPEEEAGFYRLNGLPYGEELTVVTVNRERFVPSDSDIHPIFNDEINATEISELFRSVGWNEEADMGAQFEKAFYEAICSFTLRIENGRLIGMQRINFDGKSAQMWNLVVHPDHQGQGIGTAILGKIIQYDIDHIAKKGYETYGLALNDRMPLYEKIGLKKAPGLAVVTNNPKL